MCAVTVRMFAGYEMYYAKITENFLKVPGKVSKYLQYFCPYPLFQGIF